MELDCKYVLHIPLSRWENDGLKSLDVDDQIKDLINQLELNGFDSFYITKVESYYKSRKYDELLITIFAGTEESPQEIFKDWFSNNNDVLGQEAFAYELNNKLFIKEF